MSAPNSLKRLAEIKQALVDLWASDTPPRVKRWRERLLREERDRIAIEEPKVKIPEGMCTRCQETAVVPGSTYCHPCIVDYLDILPRWVIMGTVTQEWADSQQTQLMKTLLDNHLIGIPDEKTEAVHG
jgi:hypothetical protein